MIKKTSLMIIAAVFTALSSCTFLLVEKSLTDSPNVKYVREVFGIQNYPIDPKIRRAEAKSGEPLVCRAELQENGAKIVDVLPGEGLWNVIRRHLEKEVLDDPEKYGASRDAVGDPEQLEKFLNYKTLETLKANGLASEDGMEIRAYRLGTQVVFEPGGKIKIIGDFYAYGR